MYGCFNVTSSQLSCWQQVSSKLSRDNWPLLSVCWYISDVISVVWLKFEEVNFWVLKLLLQERRPKKNSVVFQGQEELFCKPSYVLGMAKQLLDLDFACAFVGRDTFQHFASMGLQSENRLPLLDIFPVILACHSLCMDHTWSLCRIQVLGQDSSPSLCGTEATLESHRRGEHWQEKNVRGSL